MDELHYTLQDGNLVISLVDKIDSANAHRVEAAIRSALQKHPSDTVILDCEKLDYISSAGLRVLLRLKQDVDDTRLVNVSPDLYEIFDMTGFVEMMDIQKRFRTISVEGCEVIGQGANGKVYRIDSDTVVKSYFDSDALPEIKRERELARTAFVAGVPTAIPYDVVRIKEGGYGSVFELLNATSYAKLLIRGEKTVDEVVEMSVQLLKLIHSRTVKTDALPNMKAVATDWADFLTDYLPTELSQKLSKLIADVPEDDHILHGDYHIKNVMLQNGESLLIDMDTLCHGHPIFEFASIYNAYAGFAVLDHSIQKDFLGISYETSVEFWQKTLRKYFDTDDAAFLQQIEDKAKIIGHARIMRRTIRRGGLETENGRAMIEACSSILAELLPRTDSLTF